MTLSQKTQNRVLGRSAGVPCEVASGLRSHGFGAMEDDPGKKTMRQFPHGSEAKADISGTLKGIVLPFLERQQGANLL